MTALIVLLLLVGLPLLVRRLGRQGLWTGLRARMAADPAAELLRQHGLAAREAAMVTAAVDRGRELDDPALRRAAVDLARLSLSRQQPSGTQGAAGPVAILLLVSVWVSLVLADAAFALAFGRLGDVNWFTLVGAAVVLSSPIRRGFRLHRAIALNADRPGARD
ncbi:MAG: hypothetical protein ACLGI3_12985 [Actinomycetes bacterium]